MFRAGRELHGRATESVSVKDSELVHGLLPVVSGSAPFGGDVSQREPDQLGGGFVSREMAPGLDDLA